MNAKDKDHAGNSSGSDGNESASEAISIPSFDTPAKLCFDKSERFNDDELYDLSESDAGEDEDDKDDKNDDNRKKTNSNSHDDSCSSLAPEELLKFSNHSQPDPKGGSYSSLPEGETPVRANPPVGKDHDKMKNYNGDSCASLVVEDLLKFSNHSHPDPQGESYSSLPEGGTPPVNAEPPGGKYEPPAKYIPQKSMHFEDALRSGGDNLFPTSLLGHGSIHANDLHVSFKESPDYFGKSSSDDSSIKSFDSDDSNCSSFHDGDSEENELNYPKSYERVPVTDHADNIDHPSTNHVDDDKYPIALHTDDDNLLHHHEGDGIFNKDIEALTSRNKYIPTTGSVRQNKNRKYLYIITGFLVIVIVALVVYYEADDSLWRQYTTPEVPSIPPTNATDSYATTTTDDDDALLVSIDSENNANKPQQQQEIVQLPSPLENKVGTDGGAYDIDTLSNQLQQISGDIVFDTTSYQYKAIEWLSTHGPLPYGSSIEETYILGLLYYATGGETTWQHSANFMNDSVSVCDWHVSFENSKNDRGAFCENDDVPGHVTKLDFSRLGLEGTLPTEIVHLSALEHIDLDSNILRGTLPTEFGRLSNIVRFSVRNNDLTGTIPTELGNIGSSSIYKSNGFLGFANNAFTGTIPTEFGNLFGFRFLFLNGNHLTGSIPSEFGNLSSLNIMNLKENELRGKIPKELGRLDTKLAFVYLQNNQLTGSVPTELGGGLSSKEFKEFHVSNNFLSGSFPSEFGYLVALRKLSIHNNNILGDIGDIFCDDMFDGLYKTIAFPQLQYIIADSCIDRQNIESNVLGSIGVICECCCCPIDNEKECRDR